MYVGVEEGFLFDYETHRTNWPTNIVHWNFPSPHWTEILLKITWKVKVMSGIFDDPPINNSSQITFVMFAPI